MLTPYLSTDMIKAKLRKKKKKQKENLAHRGKHSLHLQMQKRMSQFDENDLCDLVKFLFFGDGC